MASLRLSLAVLAACGALAQPPATPLQLGAVLRSRVASGTMVYYVLDAPMPFVGLHVSVMSSYGNANVFASVAGNGGPTVPVAPLTPGPGASDYASTTPLGVDVLNMYPTDPVVRTHCVRTQRANEFCRFIIGVSSTTPIAGVVISAYADGTPRPLPSGTPLVDTLLPGVYLYYSYTLPSAASTVTFALTAYSGMPGLYVSANALPGVLPRGDAPGSFCASSTPSALDGSAAVASYGVLTLTPGSPCAAACGGVFPCVVTLGVGSPDYGVFALTPSEAVPLGAAGVVTLFDTVAVRSEGSAASAGAPGTQLYDFTFVPAAVSLLGPLVTLSLSHFSGAQPSTLYASWDVPPSAWSSVTPPDFSGFVPPFSAVQPPTAASAQYAAATVAGSATVAISPYDPAFVAACGGAASTLPCTLHIALSAPLSAAYVLSAHTDTGLSLGEGVPVMGEVLASPGAPLTYFRFTRSYPLSSIVIAVTPLTGPVDVFISNSAQPGLVPPTAAASFWRATSVSSSLASGASVVVINPYDAGACSAPCIYYIAVRAGVAALEDQVVSFSLLVHTRGLTTSSLLDGQPTMDATYSGGDANAFAFPVPPAASTVTLALTPLVGDGATTLWVSGGGPTPSASGVGAAFSLGPLAVIGKERRLTLSRYDPLLAPYCATSTTVLQNITSLVCVDLLGGFCVKPACYDRAYGPASPSPNCFFANRTAPTPVAVPVPAPCTLSVVATSSSSAVFTLVASSGARMLQDGVGTVVDIAPGTTTHLVFEAAARASRVKLSLTSLYGVAVAVVTTTPPPQTGAAGATTPPATFTFGGIGAPTATLDAVNAGCAATATRCLYYVSLSAYSPVSHAASASASAQVRVQGSSVTVVPLSMNAPTPGSIVAASTSGGAWVYFSFTVRAGDSAGVDVLVEAVRGSWVLALAGSHTDPATGLVYMPALVCSAAPGSNAMTCPGAVESVHVTASSRGGLSRTALRLDASTPGFAPGATFVLGFTSAADADFFVTLRAVRDLTVLANGVPLHDELAAPGDAAFYTVTVPAGSRPAGVLLEATAIAGYVQLYLGVGPAQARPSATSNIGVSSYADNYRFNLSPATLALVCPALATTDCDVYVGAYPMNVTSFPVVYTIVGTLGPDATATLLQPGVPELGSVRRGVAAYFFTPLPAGATSAGGAYVSVVDIFGSTVLLVNTDGTFASTLTGAAAAASLTPKIVPLFRGGAMLSPSAKGVTVSVYGTALISQFYVTVSLNNTVTELPDGASLQASAPSGGYAYFSLAVPASASDVQVSMTSFSGSATLYGSPWYVSSDGMTGAQQAFRPSAPPTGHAFTSNFEGSLLIARANPAACAGACTYIFGAYCSGAIPCSFSVSATATSTSLVRLGDGVPSEAMAREGSYRYFIYDGGASALNITITAQATEGRVTLLASSAWVPGVSPASALPSVASASSYRWISADSDGGIYIAQAALPPWMPVVGVAGAVTTRGNLYVIAVYVVAGPATFSVVVRPASTPVVLQPGVPSANHLLAQGGADMYSFDNQDMERDLIVDVSLLYGAVTLTAASRLGGMTPLCTITLPPAGSDFDAPATAACPAATWQVASSGSRALLRISPASPCNPSAGATPSCFPTLDWVPGPLNIVVTGTLDALYTISVTTGTDAVRALDGYPLDFTQTQLTPSAPVPVVIMFSTLPDALLSPVYITFASDTQLASFDWYLSSCTDALCTDALMRPGPGSALAEGYSDAGARDTVSVGPTTPATRRAFCTGSSAAGDVCNYFLVLVPNGPYCAARALAPCTTHSDVTFWASGGSAPVRLDYAQLKDRLVVLQGVLRPSGASGASLSFTNYMLYINRPSAPPEDTVDLVVRLESCDALRGHAVAYACTTSARDGLPPCAAPAAPTPGNAQYALSTVGAGFDRLGLLGEPSNLLYLALGSVPFLNPNRTLASDAAMLRYGPATYSLQITDGVAARLRLPDPAATTTFSRINATATNVTWTPVVATVGNELGAANVTAVGVTYYVYWAPTSFSSYASSLLNVSVAELGIMPATACGLERWASLIAGSFTPIVIPPGAPASFVLSGLVPGAPYRMNIVARCSDDCLALNYDALNVTRPTGAQSTQRLAYMPTVFVNAPDPTVVVEHLTEVSAALYGIGVFLVILAFGGALAMGFRRAPPGAAAKFGTVEQGAGDVVATGPGGRVVKVSRFSPFFSARELQSSSSAAAAAADALASSEEMRIIGFVTSDDDDA